MIVNPPKNSKGEIGSDLRNIIKVDILKSEIQQI
jgi:hypothetical protein